MKEVKISSTTIYNGKILRLDKDIIEINGNTAVREVIRHGDGVAILFIKNNKILLVKQYRYPYNEFIYEIPAGMLEENEEPIVGAIRELEEETANKVQDLKYLGTMYPSCGYLDEKIHIFYGTDSIITKTNFDQDEDIESSYVEIDEVKKMILDGRIKDAKTICAISYYLIGIEK